MSKGPKSEVSVNKVRWGRVLLLCSTNLYIALEPQAPQKSLKDQLLATKKSRKTIFMMERLKLFLDSDS